MTAQMAAPIARTDVLVSRKREDWRPIAEIQSSGARPPAYLSRPVHGDEYEGDMIGQVVEQPMYSSKVVQRQAGKCPGNG